MDAFWQAVTQHDWTPSQQKIEFRVYFDDHGKITCYSMEDLPGNYIVVDRHTWEQTRMDLRVKDGQLIKITQAGSWRLVPDADGDHHCHSQDICIVVPASSENTQLWKVKITHEEN